MLEDAYKKTFPGCIADTLFTEALDPKEIAMINKMIGPQVKASSAIRLSNLLSVVSLIVLGS